jgi:hypothetical protein
MVWVERKALAAIVQDDPLQGRNQAGGEAVEDRIDEADGIAIPVDDGNVGRVAMARHLNCYLVGKGMGSCGALVDKCTSQSKYPHANDNCEWGEVGIEIQSGIYGAGAAQTIGLPQADLIRRPRLTSFPLFQ